MTARNDPTEGYELPDNRPATVFQRQPSCHGVQDIQQFIKCFHDSKIGAALFDRTRTLVAVNLALVQMNRGSIESHTGKSLRDLVDEKCCPVGAAVDSVFRTAETVHIQFTAKLATRDDEAEFSITFYPIMKDSLEVGLVAGLVVENAKRSEEKAHAIDPSLLLRVAALSEQCNEAILTFTAEYQRSFEGAAIVSSVSKHSRQLGLPLNENTKPDGLTDTDELALSTIAPREKEVIRWVALGKSNKEIADFMGLVETTVETYRARVMMKLRYHSAIDLVRFAIRTKIIDA
jgi:DNA-binding CsgD family transcriptional regulator